MHKIKSTPIELPGVQLHGWDAKAEAWNGPIPLVPSRSGARTTSKVRTALGAFQGKLRCSVPGLPCIEFHTAIYDLADTGLAIIHMDGPHGGPVGILAVIPRDRRRLLRDDFAFELMTLVSFLGAPVIAGCELQINDYIEEALRSEPSATQVFAVETAELSWDASIVLSSHFENLAAAMLDWMARRERQDDAVADSEECETRPAIPGYCPPTALPAPPIGGGLAAHGAH
jgi:hypothetical protein